MNSELEQSVKEILAANLSTGHADSYTDLVTELLWQVKEFRDRIAELEAKLNAAEKAIHGSSIALLASNSPLAINLLDEWLEEHFPGENHEN